MKVILAPTLGAGNPYVELLRSSLEERGVEARLARRGRGIQLWFAAAQHGLPDVVHLQWQHPFFSGKTLGEAIVRSILFWLQWATLRLLGVRFVWTVHNLLGHERLQAAWELKCSRMLARLVDRIIVHCNGAVDIVARSYAVSSDRLDVIPHGNYVSRYPAMPEKGEARRALGFESDKVLFLYFGLIREYKGLDVLLDVLSDLPRLEVKLIILGKPRTVSLAERLASRIEQEPRASARFEFVEEKLLETYLAAADVIVLPYSDVLTSGSAVLAASCGRALIVPRVGCLAEFPPQAAILYDPSSESGLRSALEQAMHAPLEAMGEAARAFVAEAPWSLVAGRTLEVYRSAVRSG